VIPGKKHEEVNLILFVCETLKWKLLSCTPNAYKQTKFTSELFPPVHRAKLSFPFVRPHRQARDRESIIFLSHA
jgi:hypothetical protein